MYSLFEEPKENLTWEDSGVFLTVAELFQNVEAISSRNEMSAVIASFLNSTELNDIKVACYMIMGELTPPYVSAEFNFSEKSLLKVFNEISAANSLGFEVAKLRKEMGDIGRVAEEVMAKFHEKNLNSASSLTVSEVYSKLWSIVEISGAGSQQSKAIAAQELFVKLSPIEAKYIARIIVGKLRLGCSDATIIDSISIAVAGDKSQVEKVKQSYGVVADLGMLAVTILGQFRELPESEKDSFNLDELNIAPVHGIPLASRLVERVKDFGEVFTRLGDEFYAQPKFDGLRCQAHKWVDDDGAVQVRLFSRNMSDMTAMFPDVVAALVDSSYESAIFDGEVIGWQEVGELDAGGQFVPFQETMSRKRKHGVEDAVNTIPVRYYIFDVLELEGESLLEQDNEARFKILQDLKVNGLLTVTETTLVRNEEQLNELFVKAVDERLEGLIAKQRTGPYRPGVRNYEWIKLKKSMDKKLVDTVDVVIMGYYRGSGKRSGFGVGALLAGVYNPEQSRIESVTKIGTGITDEQFAQIKARLDKVEVGEKPANYDVADVLIPDVWVLPEVVCSVEADEITKSKVHRAASTILEGGFGLALRFPRLIDFDRDKRVEDATSDQELMKLGKLG